MYAPNVTTDTKKLALGGGVSLATYLTYTMIDRAIATRDSALVKTPSAPVYGDGYRLGWGVLGAATPLLLAHYYVKKPSFRSGLQIAGVTVLVGFAGKFVESLLAMALKNTDAGKRLFGSEINAQGVLAAMDNVAPKLSS